MEIVPRPPQPQSTADLLGRIVAVEGTGAHGYCRAAIARTPEGFNRNATDFADAVHHLGLLHGHVPGVIDHAAARVADGAARKWLIAVVDAFGRERAYLNHVVVAVGPLPSTAGQAEMTSLIRQQSRALDMLAQSDRRGCALGAAMALALDWAAMRAILDGGAARLGIDPPPMALPDLEAARTVLDSLEQAYPVSRAVQFGASQLLSQHRALWDVMQARAQVRRQNPY